MAFCTHTHAVHTDFNATCGVHVALIIYPTQVLNSDGAAVRLPLKDPRSMPPASGQWPMHENTRCMLETQCALYGTCSVHNLLPISHTNCTQLAQLRLEPEANEHARTLPLPPVQHPVVLLATNLLAAVQASKAQLLFKLCCLHPAAAAAAAFVKLPSSLAKCCTVYMLTFLIFLLVHVMLDAGRHCYLHSLERT